MVKLEVVPHPTDGSKASKDFDLNGVDAVVEEARAWLADRQASDGHWAFELEADATIPSEYIMLNHYLDEVDEDTESKLAAYLKETQGDHGGWPLYHDGDFNLSASVKAYFALKLTGEDIEAPYMRWARKAILEHGGAAKANVFTRFALALFGQVPWRAVPVIRVEALLLPKWAPFHINKVSYWSRTVMVPLKILAALKPLARNQHGVDIRELFVKPAHEHRFYLTNPTGKFLGWVMLGVDYAARMVQPLMPKWLERRAISKAVDFISERLNGEDGLGGIFPAMANALMAFDALEYPKDHPDYVICRQAIDKLLVLRDDWGYCQPCLSPVWDTGLAAHAMLESGLTKDDPILAKANEWLLGRQIFEVQGDWAANRGHVRPGGWAFQYWNDYYPDVDDTAVVVMALHRADPEKYREAIERGTEWIIGMQSINGGWGAFDADNNHFFLQNLPFADHGALLDPPTADVSARCLGMLAQLGYETDHPVMAKGLAFLRSEQEKEGSWFGRWGNNYVYGTWSVLCAFNAAGEDMQARHIRKAVDWLKYVQRPDGGWGEDCSTYWQYRRDEVKTSTPSQTSWALMGLMAAGEVDSNSVSRGVEYLLNAERDGGNWHEEYFNAVGFPRIFYLRYHGYSAYFPLWTLSRYRSLKKTNSKFPKYGL
ncbi:MAG TPA: squalene--hopene cyclase [Rhodospirillales bacterium]|nr:MAG: Squalene--hopene cyclase [Alphaproteobacteria bacterium MarineAlpha3_Bin1]HIM76569.1 squalene--hopene cyclase [Rhodospirillales bacterium]